MCSGLVWEVIFPDGTIEHWPALTLAEMKMFPVGTECRAVYLPAARA